MTNLPYGDLIDYLNDDLTEAECRRLADRLASDPGLAGELLAVARDEVCLLEWSRIVLADPTSSRDSLEIAVRKRAGPRLRPATLRIAAAVLLSIGLAIVYWRLDARLISPVAASSVLVASVDQESPGSRWYIENRTHPGPRDVLAGDVVRVVRGQISIRFAHDTLVVLQSPALFEVKSSMLSRVHRGSLRAIVSPRAQGFSLLTPTARVIDLGTVFGLHVDDAGRTDVAVFSGAVDLHSSRSPEHPPREPQRLRTGEAASLDERGTISRIVSIPADRFPSAAEENADSPERPAVVSEVWDNVRRPGGFQFYEIVRGGMREDAQAYVDRTEHQWNGVEASGMPAYLLGGDYIKPFNSDKLNPTLAITVRVELPAFIYVLLDDRVPTPAWLAEAFELQPEKIGLDEGPFLNLGKLDASRLPGVGAGQSVDRLCSIWRMTCHEPGIVRFGAIQGPPGEFAAYISMYGIVATPMHPHLRPSAGTQQRLARDPPGPLPKK